MAYGTVTGIINIQESPDNESVDHYIVVLDWYPIDEDETAFGYTQLVYKDSLLESLGDVNVSRPDAPDTNGELYVRVYGAKGSIVGALSNQVAIPYDFRPGAPVISLV